MAKVKTDLKTLGKAFDILDDMNLSATMGGEGDEPNPTSIAKVMFQEGKLIEFVNIISGKDEETYEIVDAVEYIELFFSDFTKGFGKLITSMGADLVKPQ